ncbi:MULTISPECIES: NrfD/PsrC family molybdoenzyme membrane anchor subunit [unclassified Adlercreutzia]|uniref:NrfD/PsrC family molybdoenzyme membrane anchor subunit n=1 Tax=unclassified Adlercreutzia TaxID=2636013 RepID=UPI001F15671F|nr:MULTISPECIES: NrfD/PsrC family molybdoenzyme membrane anchor subunit [unclassified Adlercreutzia]
MIEFQTVWGWQPALYLFLGGVGAGAFITAAVLYLIDPAKNKKLAFISSLASIACLAVGLLLLLTELTSPLRGLMVWQSFSNFGSLMAIGAWLLMATMIVIFANAVILSGKIAKVAEEKATLVCRVLSIVGIVCAAGVAVYTGVLLMLADGIPFWGTALLPCLFTVSALDTGLALTMILFQWLRKDEEAHRTSRIMEIAVLILVAVEAIIVFAFMSTMLAGGEVSTVGNDTATLAAASSAQLLVSGDLSGWFWILFVGIGLAVPFAAALASIAMGEKASAKWASIGGAVCALAGGCALRFLVLLAGTHADYITDAVSRLLY